MFSRFLSKFGFGSESQLFEKWPELPKDVKCLIIGYLTNVTDIKRFFSYLVGREKDLKIIYRCVTNITPDPQNAGVTIPADIVIQFKNLKSITAPILVSTPGQLIDLVVKPNLTFYYLVLNSDLNSEDTPEAYQNFFNYFDHLVEGIIESSKDFQTLTIMLMREKMFDQLNSFMGNLRLSFSENWKFFYYSQGNFTIIPFMGQVTERLYETLHLLDKLNALTGIIVYGDLFTAGMDMGPFIQALSNLNIKTIAVRLMISSLIGYYGLSILNPNVLTLTVPKFLPFIVGESNAISKSLEYGNFCRRGQNALQSIQNQNLSTLKSFSLLVPNYPQSIPLIFSVFPNAKAVGIYDNFKTDAEAKSFLDHFFLDHPGVELYFYTSRKFKDEYPDLVLASI